MTLAPHHHKSRGRMDAIRQAEADARTWLPGAIQAASLVFRTIPEEVTGRGREARVADARHVIYWVLREAGLSYPAIGRVMDRDHSSVLSGVRKVEARPYLLTAARAMAQGYPPKRSGR